MKIGIPLFFGLGFACFFAYGMIGSRLDENNILQEPFYFIPIGHFFLLISITLTSIQLTNKLGAKKVIPFLLFISLFFNILRSIDIFLSILGVFSVIAFISSIFTVTFQTLKNYGKSKGSNSNEI